MEQYLLLFATRRRAKGQKAYYGVGEAVSSGSRSNFPTPDVLLFSFGVARWEIEGCFKTGRLQMIFSALHAKFQRLSLVVFSLAIVGVAN